MNPATPRNPDLPTLGLAWASVVVLAILLALGTLITTYRVGMVDPVWPTEPWFLLTNWREPSAGYLIEHTHRVAAYCSGIVILAVTMAAWRQAPIALGLVPITLVAAGLAVAMTSINRELARTDPIGAVDPVRFYGGLGVAGLSALVSLAGWILRADGPEGGRSLRLAAWLTYCAVIIQGLLGGFRVYLNALMGDTLATIHGAFGQCVLALAAATLALAILDGHSFVPGPGPRRANRLLGFLLIFALMQLAWAVVVRHQGSGWAQRLHVVFAVLLAGGLGQAAMLCREEGARHLRVPVMGLTTLLLFQVFLGVEAWMGKFGTGKPLVPEAKTVGQALLRTAHSLGGAAFIGCLVATWLRSFLPGVQLKKCPAQGEA